MNDRFVDFSKNPFERFIDFYCENFVLNPQIPQVAHTFPEEVGFGPREVPFVPVEDSFKGITHDVKIPLTLGGHYRTTFEGTVDTYTKTFPQDA